MKRRYPSKITRKGQITITAQARRDVGLNIGDSVDVVVEDGRIVGVEATGSWAKRTAGILKYSGPVMTSEERRSAEKNAWPDAAVERDERTKRGEQSKPE
jgi:AbrB family looped-hinge helix DNA binding protein